MMRDRHSLTSREILETCESQKAREIGAIDY
jgi:hypothetical protein